MLVASRARLHRDDVAPQRRDRRLHHRRPRGRDELRADQDRRAGAQRSGGEVQPAPAHRRGARPGRVVPRSVPRCPSAELVAEPRRDAKRPPRRRRAKRRGVKPPSATDRSDAGAGRRGPVRTGLLLVALVGGLFAFVYPTRTFLDQRSQTSTARAQLTLLRAENAKLTMQTKELSSDSAIERLARQTYGLVKPGETPFVILPAPTTHDRRPRPRMPRVLPRRIRPHGRRRGCCRAHRAARARPASRLRGRGARPRRAIPSSCATRRSPPTARRCPRATGSSTPSSSLAVSRLEAAGGVRAAQAAVDPARAPAARTTRTPPSATPRSRPRTWDPVPSGGVGGTRVGVKCLHAHYAYFLAGGDDPVGRWVDARLRQPTSQVADGDGRGER